MAFSADTKQLRASGESCVRNGPKLADTFKQFVVDPLKKVYDETGLERFNTMYQEADKAYKSMYIGFSDNLVNAGKGLISLADDADRISKGNMK